MDTFTAPLFLIEPVSPARIEDARRTGKDISGNPVEYVTLSGGEPLRCCLRNGRPGEAAILFGYEPPLPPCPYREVGAVYAHATPCAGPESLIAYPAEWRGRAQVLRAYDRRGWIHTAQVHDGSDPETVIAAMLDDPDVVEIHSRNVAYGCYMLTVRRR